MYLLMLLATYLSAIYGYNLSARPDYDRDIVRKKALAMMYRFNYEAYVARKLVSRINANRTLAGHDYPHGMQPMDRMYTKEGDATVMVYEQGSDKHEFNLQGNNSLHFMPEGRELFDQDEMINVVYCLPLRPSSSFRSYDLNDYKDASQGGYDSDSGSGSSGSDGDSGSSGSSGAGTSSAGAMVFADDEPVGGDIPEGGSGDDPEGGSTSSDDPAPTELNCTSTPSTETDSEGNPIGVVDSCCESSSHRYLMSFKKMDARWINRLTNQISYDFRRALIEYDFAENIGYVYFNEEDRHWHFEGRIKLLPVYVDEMNAYNAEHIDDEDEHTRLFPPRLRNKTSWDMPANFFTQDFFDKASGMAGHFCEKGCLFKIRQI